MNNEIRENLKEVADEIRDLEVLREYHPYVYTDLSVDVRHAIRDVEFRVNQDLEIFAELVGAYHGR